MQEVKGITILDAFKALDEISDEVIKDEVKKVSTNTRKKLKESTDKKVIKLDISGNNMYDRGQAYYYARTGDHVDYNGKKYEVAEDDTHKIGYSDTILLKGEDGETIEVAKKDFISGAALLKESQDDYWVLSDGENPRNSTVFTELDNLDEFINKLEAGKCNSYCELLHYVNGNPKKVWDSKNGKVNEACNLKEGASKGWIAIWNGKKLEIVKGVDANDLWGAKQFAIKKLGIPKSKVHELAIDVAYADDDNDGEGGSNVQFESCNLKEEPTYDMAPEFDGRKSFYGKAKVDVRPDGTQILYSYGTPVCKITKDGEVTLLKKGYLGWASSQTTLRHVKEFLKQNGKEAGSVRELAKMYPVEQFNESINEGMKVDIMDDEKVKEGKDFLKDADEDHIEQVVDVDAETIEELKDSYLGNVILRCPSCKTLIYKKPELLEKEDSQSTDEDAVYNVGETCPHCGSKDGFELVGQVASLDVKGQEDAPTTGKDEIEITNKTVEDNKDEASAEDTESEEEVKRTTLIAKESLQKDTFDKAINRYLESTYDNVKEYKTTKCKVDGKNAIIEGVVTFNSGKEKQTSFNLNYVEGKNSKIRLVGLNETFSKTKKAFNFVCRKDNNNLVCESLSYKYNVGDKKISGKIINK